MFGSLGKLLAGTAKLGFTGASAAAKTSGSRALLRGALKAGAGYGIMAGASSLSSMADNQLPGGTQIGGFYSGLLNIGGTVIGGSMMINSAINTAGRLGKLGTKQVASMAMRNAGSMSGSSAAINQSKTVSKMYRAFNKLEKFNIGKAAIGGFKTPFGKVNPLKSIGKGGLAMMGGLAKAPFKVADDILFGMPSKAASRIPAFKNAAQKFRNDSMGSRMFGWGAAVGGAKAFIENSDGVSQARQSEGGRAMNLSGEQVWTPAQGGKARRMSNDATAGLSLSLHKLR